MHCGRRQSGGAGRYSMVDVVIASWCWKQ